MGARFHIGVHITNSRSW